MINVLKMVNTGERFEYLYICFGLSRINETLSIAHLTLKCHLLYKDSEFLAEICLDIMIFLSLFS